MVVVGKFLGHCCNVSVIHDNVEKIDFPKTFAAATLTTISVATSAKRSWKRTKSQSQLRRRGFIVRIMSMIAAMISMGGHETMTTKKMKAETTSTQN